LVGEKIKRDRGDIYRQGALRPNINNYKSWGAVTTAVSLSLVATFVLFTTRRQDQPGGAHTIVWERTVATVAERPPGVRNYKTKDSAPAFF
jgi:hypothetical protein